MGGCRGQVHGSSRVGARGCNIDNIITIRPIYTLAHYFIGLTSYVFINSVDFSTEHLELSSSR